MDLHWISYGFGSGEHQANIRGTSGEHQAKDFEILLKEIMLYCPLKEFF